MRRRWLPAPLLSAALAAGWLILERSATPGQLLLALLLGWLTPLLFVSLRPERPRLGKPLKILRLVGVCLSDGLRSNWAVLAGLLRNQRRPVNSSFVQVPLELRDPTALACLCVIATAVPGTVWCEAAPDGSTLLLHVWDLRNEPDFIADFKARYEQPLKDIFE